MRHRGKLGGYMDNYGVGWLLDQNNIEIENEDSLPILEELDINLSEIQYKIKCAIMPIGSQTLNRSVLKDNPDFWGPLVIVLAFALLSVYGQFRVNHFSSYFVVVDCYKSLMFFFCLKKKVVSWIITIWIFGSFLVFIIARVLGGEVSYSQIVGIIGYSLLPLLVIAFILPFIKQFQYLSNLVKVVYIFF
jgi:hypothetical protein